jgi:hypothetical protein
VHCRVPDDHLRFDADNADDTEAAAGIDRVLDKRGLPDAGGAGDQERTGDTAFGVGQERVDRGALGSPTDERVALMRPVSRIGYARHDAPSEAASEHTITADRPGLPNVPWTGAAVEAGDLGAGGGP